MNSMGKKGLVIGIILLFLGASATFGVSAPYTNHQWPRAVQYHIQAIQQDVVGQACLVGNVKVSPGVGNDYHPIMTTNGQGHTIIVYEQGIEFNCKQIPVVYSADDGHTWTMQFLFDSIDLYGGSGVLNHPDIVYNAPNDLLFFTMIDPDAGEWNVEMSFFPGDIANASDISLYRMMGAPGGYFESACACTDNFFVALHTYGEYGDLSHYFGLGWFCYPDYYSPPHAYFCWDGNSFFRSAPATEVEMDSNANQIFIVCETHLDTGTKITIKTNVMDEALITSGEQQNGMTKYSDIEQMPGEYLGLGTDPDVSGSGNKVCVVYEEDGNVICKSSTTSAVYDPGFNWQVSTVETDASAPAVYMWGDKVSCAYVKGGNLYLKASNDGGVTWEAAEQKNDVEGTVVAEKGAVDIGSGGIAFTDNRSGNYDIYYASYVAKPAPIVVIDSLSGGFGVTAVITNIGDAPSENFPWSITLTGSIFTGFKGKNGTVSLAPGDSMRIRTGLIVGFGAVTVTVTANTVTASKDFILLFFFFKEI